MKNSYLTTVSYINRKVHHHMSAEKASTPALGWLFLQRLCPRSTFITNMFWVSLSHKNNSLEANQFNYFTTTTITTKPLNRFGIWKKKLCFPLVKKKNVSASKVSFTLNCVRKQNFFLFLSLFLSLTLHIHIGRKLNFVIYERHLHKFLLYYHNYFRWSGHFPQ